MTWTEERVEILKKLWIDGMSAAKIAEYLGNGISRNAVIGKVHRLGLSDKDRPVKKSQHRNSSRKISPQANNITYNVKTTSQVIGNTVLKTTIEEKENLDVKYEAPRFVELVIPEEQRRSVLTITETTCKWPIGDPVEDDFYFCGANIDEEDTYCKYHASIAYQTSKKRR